MTFSLVYPLHGRAAFPASGAGGTLNTAGTKPGAYYRAPAAGSGMKMPGLAGAQALRYGTVCATDDYAVFAAVRSLQPFFGAVADGILGPKTEQAIRDYQKLYRLVVDGVIGPQTCRSLFAPLVTSAALQTDITHARSVAMAARGTITMESQWDPGAVGFIDSQDLGIGQINGPAHPSLSVDSRLNPAFAIPWIVGFIDGNFKALLYDLDASIAAYNLGRGGATQWIAAGRPEIFHGTDVWKYVAKIKAAGA